MHRSGTSGVTRLLNLAGAHFGPDGIATEADEENPPRVLGAARHSSRRCATGCSTGRGSTGGSSWASMPTTCPTTWWLLAAPRSPRYSENQRRTAPGWSRNPASASCCRCWPRSSRPRCASTSRGSPWRSPGPCTSGTASRCRRRWASGSCTRCEPWRPRRRCPGCWCATRTSWRTRWPPPPGSSTTSPTSAWPASTTCPITTCSGSSASTSTASAKIPVGVASGSTRPSCCSRVADRRRLAAGRASAPPGVRGCPRCPGQPRA